MLACQADSQGRGGNVYPKRSYEPRKERLNRYLEAALTVDKKAIAAQSRPDKIKTAINKAQTRAIAQVKAELDTPENE